MDSGGLNSMSIKLQQQQQQQQSSKISARIGKLRQPSPLAQASGVHSGLLRPVILSANPAFASSGTTASSSTGGGGGGASQLNSRAGPTSADFFRRWVDQAHLGLCPTLIFLMSCTHLILLRCETYASHFIRSPSSSITDSAGNVITLLSQMNNAMQSQSQHGSQAHIVSGSNAMPTAQMATWDEEVQMLILKVGWIRYLDHTCWALQGMSQRSKDRHRIDIDRTC